jgi:hypothetical protein
MEESGVTKLISVRLKQDEVALIDVEQSQHGLWDDNGNFEEENVENEEGRQLPAGIDDPAKVNEAQLRPIRAGLVNRHE